jgi:phage terminase large subunit-like protein
VNEGGPLVIEPFQRLMLADYFDGVRSSLILISKKNGKTTLLAALALFHLLTTPDALVVIAAASRDQAAIMLNQIRAMIRRSPYLADRLEVTKRVIEYQRHGGMIEIRASDVDTLDGVIPTLGLVDALDRHKHPDVYGVIRDGLGPRDGQMLAIATAGDDENSALGVLRRKAHAIRGLERFAWPSLEPDIHGPYRHARTADFAFHEWALNAEDDRDDLKVVKSVNPASWQTQRELRKRHRDPSMIEWQWARFACGVWLAGEASAISEREWRECAVPGQDIAAGTTGVTVGVDLATKWDTTAFVPILLEDDEVVLVGSPTILTPPRDGTAMAFDDIFDAARDMAERYPGCRFVFDPSRGGEQLAQEIEGLLEGVSVSAYSQDPRPMALAAERLVAKISAHELEHPDDPELNAHVLGAVPYWVGDRWKFVKRRRKQLPIDAVIALAMAVSQSVGDKIGRVRASDFRIDTI